MSLVKEYDIQDGEHSMWQVFHIPIMRKKITKIRDMGEYIILINYLSIDAYKMYNLTFPLRHEILQHVIHMLISLKNVN